MVLHLFAASAQTLPNIQSEAYHSKSLKKIDGVISDWPEGFAAYNKNTDIYYSLSNDANNLYLAVSATDPLIIRKIINGGVTLAVSTNRKFPDSLQFTVSYPVYRPGENPELDINNNSPEGGNASSKKQFEDSLTIHHNQLFRQRSKEIEFKNRLSPNDPIISIYNDYGVKVASSFEGNKTYTYELAVPLTYIGLTNGQDHVINYNIKLPAYRMLPSLTSALRPPPPPPVLFKDRILYSPTDFWGTYKIAAN